MGHCLRISVITMFPEQFQAITNSGVLSKLFQAERFVHQDQAITLQTFNPSHYSPKGFKGVDDKPFGGGQGQVMRADVLEKTLLEGVFQSQNFDKDNVQIIYTHPRGTVWNFKEAKELSKKWSQAQDVVFIAGRYEGVDERFLEQYVNQFYSLGDFILSGGELAIMSIIDSTLRLMPGALGHEFSAEDESFYTGAIEPALYTRPRVFNGSQVPSAYIQGNHKLIEEEKKRSSHSLTLKYRPDLLGKNE